MLIKEVFSQFLSEQKSKLAPKTYRDYASVIDLFANQLDGYQEYRSVSQCFAR